MADVHQVVTFGIGTPADIPHFILVGLSPAIVTVDVVADVTIQVRPEATTIYVRPEATTIQVRPEAATVNV